MNADMTMALQLMVQGMAGIFVVLGAIALVVMLVQKLEATGDKKRDK